MKYLIFSDCHGDWKAINSLLNQKKYSDYYKICLGDISEFDENLIKCYEYVEKNTNLIIKGNHEAILIGGISIKSFDKRVYPAIKSTIKKLKKGNTFLKKIKQLPNIKIMDNVAFTHGSFDKKNIWKPIRYIEDVKEEEKYLPKKINFIGHGHIPFLAWKENSLWFYEKQIYKKTFILNTNKTYLINVGSLLGSREMRWYEKTFLVYDSESNSLIFHNLNYD